MDNRRRREVYGDKARDRQRVREKRYGTAVYINTNNINNSVTLPSRFFYSFCAFQETNKIE